MQRVCSQVAWLSYQSHLNCNSQGSASKFQRMYAYRSLQQHAYSLIPTGAGNEILCGHCNVMVTDAALGKLLNLSLNKMETIIVEHII